MNVILDECLPRRLIRDMHGHSVTTVPHEGWTSRSNGDILSLVQADFDVFITMDKSIVHQQNLRDLSICIIVLHTANSRYETLSPLIHQIRVAVAQAKPGAIIHVG